MTEKESLLSKDEYKLEALSESIFVCVGSNHRFGTDAFLLADFASPRRKDIVCDLGCGCGIIPMLFAKNNTPQKVYGVDIQKEAVEQFECSVASSKLQSEVIPVCGDLKNLSKEQFENGSFDLVTCNPPYKLNGKGILSKGDAQKIARHEIMCNIEDVCLAAKKLLRYGGRLCICQRPERVADVITAMRENDIEPKRLRFVSKTKSDAPWLFLIEGKKSSKRFMQVLPPLFLYDKEDLQEYSDEMQAIYKGKQPE